MPIRQIVVPIDFSDASKLAARTGASLARALGARIGFVHVVELAAIQSTTVGADGHALIADDTAAMHALAAELDLKPEQYTCIVRRGDVGIALLSECSEMAAQLVVIGSVGKHGATPPLLGSVAARVVRDARCPVLVVRTEHRDVLPGDGVFHHPLVAIDHSRFSQASVEWAASISASNATIELCHVMFHPAFEHEPAADRGKLEAIFDQAQKAEVSKLSEMAGNFSLTQTIETRVVIGRAATAIAEQAQACHADLVVTGAHGRKTATSLLLGSVADRLLRQSPVPVLLVPDAAVD